MPQDSDYHNHYQSLEIKPGCTWKELKEAYRRAVKTWHPDRFIDENEKAEAEEKIKAINIAFDSLSDYFKGRGVLPLSSPGPSKERPTESSIPASDQHTDTNGHTGWADIQTAQKRRLFTLPRMMVLLIVGSLSYAIWSVFLENEATNTSGPYSTPSRANNGDTGNPLPTGNKPKKYFTIGSTLGEVYDAQGKPDRTEEGIWHYGESKIFFKDGKVVKWNESASKLLNATMSAVQPKTELRTFTYGSSKDEVLAAMGMPTLISKEEWLYGVSRVNFKDGKVIGWYSSPLDPLTGAKEK